MKMHNKVVSRAHPIQHQIWGSQCEAWVLVDKDSLSIKWERMPPKTAEQRHCHRLSGQFFFILKGKAVLEIEQEIRCLSNGEGIYIEAGQPHCILNEEEEDLEFLISSQPSVQQDRFLVE